MGREYLQGVPVDLYLKSEVFELITKWLLKPDHHRQIVTMNALILISATQNLQLNRVIRDADLITIDGHGIIMALRKKGHQSLEQFTGIDLTKELLSWCALQNYPVFFYGGSPTVAGKLQLSIAHHWPGLSIQGIWNGYGGRTRQLELLDELRRAQPPLLLVGLGSPAQELFLAKTLPQLKNTVGIGVGGTLEVLAGLKREAPRFIRERGFEWLYRMIQDPVKLKRLPDLLRFWYHCLR